MLIFHKNLLFILFLIIFYNQFISAINLENKNKILTINKQFEDKGKGLNECMSNCINGNCNEENKCICLPNYSGDNCNTSKFKY